MVIVKPQAKKAKVDVEAKLPSHKDMSPSNGHEVDKKVSDQSKAMLGSLVAYDDDDSSEDEDWQESIVDATGHKLVDRDQIEQQPSTFVWQRQIRPALT